MHQKNGRVHVEGIFKYEAISYDSWALSPPPKKKFSARYCVGTEGKEVLGGMGGSS
jgi:hypothetical protein